MKGIILAGGLGTRMQPATISTNKHVLPVYSKHGAVPMIDYPINTLSEAGITEILIITSQEHCGIIVDYLGDGYSRGLDFTYKIQEMNDPERPPGIASALKLCEGFTNNDDFVVVLGDNYFEPEIEIGRHLNQWSNDVKTECGLFLKYTVDWKRFGVAKLGEGNKIIKIVEKPSEFVSSFAVTGMYYYTPDVYKIAETITPSNRGELEITDINNHYASIGNIKHFTLGGFWSDMGTPESMINTLNFINKK